MNDDVRMPPARRRFLRAASGAACLALLAACQRPALALRVGSIVFPGYEFLFLARDLNMLSPDQVRLVEMHANTETLRALAAGQLEAAALTVDELMGARADGVDLVVIAVLDISAGADAVLARPGIGLQNLRGTRIGVEDGAVGAVMLAALLEKAGLRPLDIQKIPMSLPLGEQAFMAKEVDVVVTADPWAWRIERAGGVRLMDSRQIPDRIVDVLAVRRDVLVSQAQALHSLVRAHFSALDWFKANPSMAATRMAPRLQMEPADLDQVFRGLNLPDVAANRSMLAKGGAFERTTLQLQQYMTESGLIGRAAPMADLADMQFLPT